MIQTKTLGWAMGGKAMHQPVESDDAPDGRTRLITCQCGKDKMKVPYLLLCPSCDRLVLDFLRGPRR